MNEKKEALMQLGWSEELVNALVPDEAIPQLYDSVQFATVASSSFHDFTTAITLIENPSFAVGTGAVFRR